MRAQPSSPKINSQSAVSGTVQRRQWRALVAGGATAFLLISAAGTVGAAEGLVVGPGITYGDGSHPGSVHTVGANPAGIAASRRVGLQFGLGGVGAGYEMGDLGVVTDQLERLIVEHMEDVDEVDGFADAINELSDQLSSDNPDIQGLGNLVDAFEEEDVLGNLGDHGTIKAQGYARPPTMPLVIGTQQGGWGFAIDADLTAHGGFRMLDDDILIDSNLPDPVQTGSSVYLKGGNVGRLAFAYSLRVGEWQDRGLYVGVRANHYDAELFKSVVGIQGMDGDFADVLEDELEANTNRDSAVGVDLGLIYQASFFRAGVTVNNINEPELDFPAVGIESCGDIDKPDQRRNCYAARGFSDRIDLEETWQLNQQAKIDAALHTPGQNMVFAVSYDTNTVRDISGDEYQWLALSGSYSLPWFLAWIPDLRVGYRENLAGSELSYYTAGLSWLGVLSLDAALSEQEVEFEGNEVPRSAMASLSLQLRF